MANLIEVTNIRSGNPGLSGWNEILPKPAPARLLEKTVTADWLVIGGGFAGLAAARRLRQNRPHDQILLLEAIRIGEGAAGRSSGFMIDLPHDLNSDSYAGGAEKDRKQTEMNRKALAFAVQAAQEYGFSKEILDARGKINVAATKKGDRHNRDYAEHLKELGENSTWLDATEMKRISGTDYYLSGLYTPGAIMIQPAGFVRGMAEGLRSEVNIYENSPVISLRRQESDWKVKTSQGTVSVPKIILAVNGHLQSFGFMKQRLMHIFLFASMTRTLTEKEINKLGGERNWEFVPADPMGSTVRRISGKAGDRIVVRNKFKFKSSVEISERSLEIAGRDHDRSFTARFPMLKAVEMEYRWGGRLCLSWNDVPVFGELEDGIFAACCQNGLGASKGTLSGILAADYATGTENPYVADYLDAEKPSLLPPEPFASIGATVYLHWKEKQAGREK